MRVIVITPPEPVVSLDEAKLHLKLIDHDDDDTLIEGYVEAATAHLDGPDGWLGRALGVQTLEARFDLPSCGAIRLPYPPTIDLVSVQYLNAAEVLTTASLADFEMYGADLAPVATWPWIGGSTRREAGRVRYHAGYAKLPAAIRQAILLMVDDLYRNRGEAVIDAISSTVPMSATVKNLLSPFQVWV